MLRGVLLATAALVACLPAPPPTPSQMPLETPTVVSVLPTPAATAQPEPGTMSPSPTAARAEPTVGARLEPTAPPRPATTAVTKPRPAASPSPEPTGGAARPDAATLPFRSAPEAIEAYARRLSRTRAALTASELDGILRTPLAESKVGFVNGHHLLESEVAELGHFSFALNPLYNEATNGRQRFLVFGNSPNFLNYRATDLGDVFLQNHDRAVWGANNGLRAVAVIQVDNELDDDLLRQIVASRVRLGFRAFVVGNEFNDPGAPWRYDLPRLLRATQVVKETIGALGVKDGEVYTSGLAYFEIERHLDALLAHFRGNSRSFPADGISVHFYGAVDAVRAQVDATEALLKKYQLDRLRLRIGELGSPTDTFHLDFPDEQLAYNYFPQAIALALQSGQVDSLDVFSMFDFGRDRFSLTALEASSLKPKTSLLATVQSARVFSRIRDVDYEVDGEIHRVVVERSDGLTVWAVWSSAGDQELSLRRPSGAKVFGALGNRLDEDRIVLTPRPHAALAGTLKYVVLED
jgi:hypothetical protein